MRDISVGADTWSYVESFHKATVLEFDHVKRQLEALFQVYEYFARCLTANYHIYLLMSSFSICWAFYKMFDRYFKEPYEVLAGICIYVLLGIFAFNEAGIRQTIAMSLGILAFLAIDKGKIIPCIVLIIMATLFHNTALILLLLIPTHYFDLRKISLIGALVIAVIGYFASDSISLFLKLYFTSEERFSGYSLEDEGQSYTAFFLQLILVVVAYVGRNNILLPQKTKNQLFSIAYIGLGIQSASGVLFEFFRLSFFFSMFDTILIPIALASFNGKSARMIRMVFIVGSLTYIFILSGGTLPRPYDHPPVNF